MLIARCPSYNFKLLRETNDIYFFNLSSEVTQKGTGENKKYWQIQIKELQIIESRLYFF